MKCQRCGAESCETDGVENDIVVSSYQLTFDFTADFCPKCLNDFREELLTSQEWLEWSQATTMYNRIEESHPIYGEECPKEQFEEYLLLVAKYDKICMERYVPLVRKVASLLRRKTG